MLIPSRAWGFVRVGLNGRFGVLVADFGAGGEFDNPLDNDVDAGDAAAGVEFCPVFGEQPSSGTLTVRTDGSLSHVGAADGTYVIPYDLYTFTPGDSASVDEGATSFTTIFGAAEVTSELDATGGSGTLSAATTVSPVSVLAATGASGTLSAATEVGPNSTAAITGGSGTLSAATEVSPVSEAALSGGSGTLSASTAAGGAQSELAATGGSGTLAAASSVSPISVADISGGSGTLSAATSVSGGTAGAGEVWGYLLPNGMTAGDCLVQVHAYLEELHRIHGLQIASPLRTTPFMRSAGDIEQTIVEDSIGVTVQRQ